MEIPKTPARNRSAKKSPVAKPKGVIAGIASALCRKWKGRFYPERKTLEKELLSFFKPSQKSRTPHPHSSKRPSEETSSLNVSWGNVLAQTVLVTSCPDARFTPGQSGSVKGKSPRYPHPAHIPTTTTTKSKEEKSAGFSPGCGTVVRGF